MVICGNGFGCVSDIAVLTVSKSGKSKAMPQMKWLQAARSNKETESIMIRQIWTLPEASMITDLEFQNSPDICRNDTKLQVIVAAQKASAVARKAVQSADGKEGKTINQVWDLQALN